MIIWDTETTDLVKPVATRLSQQPQIIEYAAIKLDDKTLEEVGRLEFKFKNDSPLQPQIIKITGLRDSDLINMPKFGEKLHELREFHLGERIFVAHNLAFDSNMLQIELRRLDAMHKFPWPYHGIDTVNETYHIKGFRLNLSKLHEHCFGKPFEGAHRAMVDVEALTRCVIHLIKAKVITIPTF